MDDNAFFKSAAEKLSADSEEIRYDVVRKLVEYRSINMLPLLIEALKDSSYRVREKSLEGICSFSQDAVFPKLEGFLRNDDNANLRSAAMEAFPRYGTAATSYLLRLLNDPDHEVRMFSANILGEICDPSAVDDLINVLNDPDENVISASIESLGKIGDARAVGALINCLYQEFWIQYPAIIALGEIGDPSAIEHLTSLLNDAMFREAVIESLGKIGDVSAIPVLAEILSHNDASVRNHTIASLVNIQRAVQPDGDCLQCIRSALDNENVIGHLISSLENPDSEIKKNATIALGWLKEAC